MQKQNRFVIDIRYQEHATWQGEVLWVDQNRKCSFRSVLELLKLMEGALETKDTTGKTSFDTGIMSKGEKVWERS